MDIQIEVHDKIAAAIHPPQIVCGNSDYHVLFSLDAEWDAYSVKTARFAYCRNKEWQYQDVLFEGDSVQMPVLNDIYEVAIGLYAGNLHTTTPARLVCIPSITDGAPVHDIPAPDVYNQLLQYLADIVNGRQNVAEAALLVAPLPILPSGIATLSPLD